MIASFRPGIFRGPINRPDQRVDIRRYAKRSWLIDVPIDHGDVRHRKDSKTKGRRAAAITGRRWLNRDIIVIKVVYRVSLR
jgi:hypothetical protein